LLLKITYFRGIFSNIHLVDGKGKVVPPHAIDGDWGRGEEGQLILFLNLSNKRAL
jgi:hypothetical protein